MVLAFSSITGSPNTKESTSATFLSKIKLLIFASLLSDPANFVPTYSTRTFIVPPFTSTFIVKFRLLPDTTPDTDTAHSPTTKERFSLPLNE